MAVNPSIHTAAVFADKAGTLGTAAEVEVGAVVVPIPLEMGEAHRVMAAHNHPAQAMALQEAAG